MNLKFFSRGWIWPFFMAALPARAVTTIENPLKATSLGGVIANIVDFIFQLGLAIAVIVFLVGGFQYLFSFGSEQKVESAKNTLWYGVVGVIIMLVGKSITGFIKNVLA